MSNSRKFLCWLYAAMAAVSLVLTWSQLLPIPPGGGGVTDFWDAMRVNGVTRAIGIDMGFYMLAGSFFIVTEARRLNMRAAWLYILLAYMIDVCVFFPVFMIMRERAMARAGEELPTLKPIDVITLSAIGLLIAWQCWIILR